MLKRLVVSSEGRQHVLSSNTEVSGCQAHGTKCNFINSQNQLQLGQFSRHTFPKQTNYLIYKGKIAVNIGHNITLIM